MKADPLAKAKGFLAAKYGGYVDDVDGSIAGDLHQYAREFAAEQLEKAGDELGGELLIDYGRIVARTAKLRAGEEG